MTEQEAIKYIESHGYISDDVKDIAINALEEIQQYRALGTVSEIQCIYVEYIMHEPLYKQYHAIGTPEECKAAVEKKQTAYNVKKVVEQIKSMSPANYVSKDDVLKIVKGGGVNE